MSILDPTSAQESVENLAPEPWGPTGQWFTHIGHITWTQFPSETFFTFNPKGGGEISKHYGMPANWESMKKFLEDLKKGFEESLQEDADAKVQQLKNLVRYFRARFEFPQPEEKREA
jgi:hypothetical protein